MPAFARSVNIPGVHCPPSTNLKESGKGLDLLNFMNAW
jgi:hypothetical protein